MKIKKRRFTRWLYVFSAVSVALYIPSAFASSLSADQQKLSELQTQKAGIEKQVNADATRALALKNAVATYDNSIHAVDVQIQSSDVKMASLQLQARSLEAQLVKNESDLAKQQSELAQILIGEYEDGNVSYLAVLFHATSFSDFLSRIYDLSIVSNTQHQVVQSVKTLQDQIRSNQAQVKSSEVQLEQVRSQMISLQQTDVSLKSQKQKALVNVESAIQDGKAKQGLLESQIKLTQSDIQAIEAATQAAEAQANNPAYVQQQQASLVSASASSIIQYAETFMGTPYVWGGTSPSGFDCSGFTQYVFAHFGVYINRTSEDQFASGVPVSQSNLQPGDLVFFSTYAPGATHVGIYIGNGLMVDSQDMGVSIDGVFNSYWGPKYIGARRYIK